MFEMKKKYVICSISSVIGAFVNKQKGYTISVALPKDLFEELDRMAIANYTNRASIMRKAVSEYIDNFRKVATEDIIKKIEKMEKSDLL
ncbi:MAG: ribbon-helix-helix domain-containing protein [Holosporales bacterium]|jgi:metal-responsive CopG/Arc/MetJ family transcriptional regulator|nr:ribbon-helix-helix domain-containing protein [Holosporales bacterium]